MKLVQGHTASSGRLGFKPRFVCPQSHMLEIRLGNPGEYPWLGTQSGITSQFLWDFEHR